MNLKMGWVGAPLHLGMTVFLLDQEPVPPYIEQMGLDENSSKCLRCVADGMYTKRQLYTGHFVLS